MYFITKVKQTAFPVEGRSHMKGESSSETLMWVALSVLPINQESIICKLFIVINNYSLQQVKDFEDLVRAVVGHCSIEEQERLREMEDWIVKVFA